MGYAPQILVVDEEPAVHMEEEALSSVGYPVTAVGRSRLGLAQLRSREFSAVIVSLSLLDQDGVELIRRIHSEFPRIPVLALFEPAAADLGEKAIAAGANDTLVKPVTPDALLLKIYRLIEPRGTWAGR